MRNAASFFPLRVWQLNAGAHLRPEAGAQRTLEGVGSGVWFGEAYPLLYSLLHVP
jgi:hypothetical protein